MPRLSDRAFNILRAEICKCAETEGLAGTVQRDIVLKRLEKLRLSKGEPASISELRQSISDIFPHFSEKVLKQAANANRPAGIWGLIPIGALFLAGGAGLVWLVNLPYPMLRLPVARTAPILLLPSYLSMDRHYRQAIALVEQSDQLVNNATSAADIDLGEEKVKQAQESLNQLPVWFLGYQPQFYCSFFSCQWRFTLDEFELARKNVGRMEAKVFQEKNAQGQLASAEQKLRLAKQKYQGAKPGTEQQQAIASWQAALDDFQEVPASTLAGELALKKAQAAERDFQEVVGDTAGRQRTNTLIEAAKTFAMSAAIASQNPPHSVEKWQQIAELWKEAIERLTQVPLQDAGYLDAQKKLAEYQTNFGVVQIRQQVEQDSLTALMSAKNAIANWQQLAGAESLDWGSLASELQSIVNQLENVKPGTTAFAEAQDLLKFARTKQQQIKK